MDASKIPNYPFAHLEKISPDKLVWNAKDPRYSNTDLYIYESRHYANEAYVNLFINKHEYILLDVHERPLKRKTEDSSDDVTRLFKKPLMDSNITLISNQSSNIVTPLPDDVDSSSTQPKHSVNSPSYSQFYRTLVDNLTSIMF